MAKFRGNKFHIETLNILFSSSFQMAKLNGTVTVNATEMDDEKCDAPLLEKHNYTLPSFRYTNIFIAVVIIDGILSCLLWLTGKYQ
jgi:hypothetical protein